MNRNIFIISNPDVDSEMTTLATEISQKVISVYTGIEENIRTIEEACGSTETDVIALGYEELFAVEIPSAAVLTFSEAEAISLTKGKYTTTNRLYAKVVKLCQLCPYYLDEIKNYNYCAKSERQD